ncbi:MAG TPA: peptidylprolyl isomerase, partial [Armatimonadota bacterium]|nr:peptidylprolyl isomerase [Armatimonadota bacterium]
MGFIQLKQKMRKAVKPVFYLIIVIFVVGAFYSFGSAPNSNQGPDGGPAPDRDVSKIVAVVNGDKIPRTSLDGYLYEVERRSGGPIPVEQHRYVLQNWLESNINEIANVQAVAEADIDISSDEIEQKRIDIIDAQLEPQIESRTALAARLEREGLTLDEYRENLLRELRNSDRGSNAAIRTLLGYEKLQEAIEATVTVSDEDLKASFAELTAREITVSADTLRWDAQQPIDDEIAELEKEIEAAAELDEEAAADRQQKLDELTVDRDALENRDFESEARETIDGLLEQLQGGADFAELAEKHSTSSTSENGGEMTTAQTRRNMPAEVWTAASALEPGQITGVVESYYGLQIIKVEGREPALPDDFEDAKETHRTTLTTELQN